jgi:hypothetical protein
MDKITAFQLTIVNERQIDYNNNNNNNNNNTNMSTDVNSSSKFYTSNNLTTPKKRIESEFLMIIQKTISQALRAKNCKWTFCVLDIEPFLSKNTIRTLNKVFRNSCCVSHENQSRIEKKKFFSWIFFLHFSN